MPFDRPLRVVRRRLRLQAALDGGALAAALGPAGIVALVAGVVALLHFPSRARYAVAPPPPPHLVVDRAALEPELAAAQELAALAEQGGDVETAQMAKQINELLQQIDAE